MSKRIKLSQQRDIKSFFSTRTKETKRLVCKGSLHQGEVANGGSQCVCASLVFLVNESTSTTFSQEAVDKIIHEATQLYQKISTDNNCLLLSELPDFVEIGGDVFNILRTFDSRCGLMSQTVDDSSSMTFSISSSLHLCFAESNTVLLTIGGSTIGIKRVPENVAFTYLLMDSHSRDDNGLCSSGGTSVVLEMKTQDSLADHIRNLAASLIATNDQYELTAVVARKCLNTIGDNDARSITMPQPSDRTVIREAPSDTSQYPLHVIVSEESSNESPCIHHATESDTPTLLPPSDCNSATLGEDPTTLTQSHVIQNPREPAACTTNSDDIHTRSLPDVNAQDNQSNDRASCLNQQTNIHSEDHTSLDIKNYDASTFSDDMKMQLIQDREPDLTFIFPPKIYKDKRNKSGEMKRYCKRDWFKAFPFISYSKDEDGLYCLACVIFPDSSHRRSKWFITEPFSNWKHAVEDMRSHSACSYHLNSMEKLESFKKTYKTPSLRIDVSMNADSFQKVNKNREILRSILKTVVFCGRQGIALRSHRDDDTASKSSLNMGNFKELLKFRVDAGDKVLEDHLSSCAKNASYTSKTAQNELLHCVKSYIQQTIVDEVKSQAIGPLFGFQCDEVTDSSNWEQLGIVLRYTSPESKPVERLLTFVACEEITGASISEKIIQALQEVGLDPCMCRSQTMDGAGNMAGKVKGCAAMIQQQYNKAVYHYCSSHDLNLALSKSCQVKEIHIMLDSLKQLGLFFKYSPKRSRRLETAIDEVNQSRTDQIKKSKFKLFCETRWVEKHTCLDDFDEMYEALLLCLEAISSLESGWDTKAVIDANGLLKKITDPTFIYSFQTVHQYFAYFSGLSCKLQGSTLDVIEAYDMIERVKSLIAKLRNDEEELNIVHEKSEQMASIANVSLEPPRRCGRQSQRSNVPSSTPKEFFRRAIYLPYVDALLGQVNMRFSSLSKHAVHGLILVPKFHNLITEDKCESILEYFRDDLPSPSTFKQEVKLWQHLWTNTDNKPDTLQSTVSNQHTCRLMFPNIYKVLHLLMLTSVTSSSVERGNSALKFIKNKLRSTMSEDRFNALALMYIHKDIDIDIDKVVTLYARRNPRKMLLLNPLSDK